MEGICLLSNVAIRAEADHRSEMTSQLLFGETFAVEDNSGEWWHIRTLTDDYAGWVRSSAVELVSERFSFSCIVTLPIAPCVASGAEHPIYLPGGSLCPKEYKGVCYTICGSMPEEKGDIAAYAQQYMNAPYLWGGRTLLGIDCSGLAQVTARMAGVWLPRDAHLQQQCGTAVPIAEAARNDMAFFCNDAGRVVHVGILADASHIIHASGCVRIDSLDEKGIYSDVQKKYTHKLHSIKRIK